MQRLGSITRDSPPQLLRPFPLRFDCTPAPAPIAACLRVASVGLLFGGFRAYWGSGFQNEGPRLRVLRV